MMNRVSTLLSISTCGATTRSAGHIPVTPPRRSGAGGDALPRKSLTKSVREDLREDGSNGSPPALPGGTSSTGGGWLAGAGVASASSSRKRLGAALSSKRVRIDPDSRVCRLARMALDVQVRPHTCMLVAPKQTH